MVGEGDGWGAAHWERPLEIDCCCVLVRGREGVGWSNGKTVMRVVQGKKDPSTGRTSSACGVVWLRFVFRVLGMECGYLAPLPPSIYMRSLILCSCIPLARWTLTLSSTVEHAAPPRPSRFVRRLKRLVSLCVHAPPATQSLRRHEDPLPSAL